MSHFTRAARALTYSQGLPAIAGDARCTATLPADGVYTLEIHDALYRGDGPGFFRLKARRSSLRNVVYPLAVQQGVKSTFEYGDTSFAGERRGSHLFTNIDNLPRHCSRPLARGRGAHHRLATDRGGELRSPRNSGNSRWRQAARDSRGAGGHQWSHLES